VREFIVEADGGSRGNPGPAGYGAVVIDAATGETLAEAAEYIGIATNNVAEYTALIRGLETAAGYDAPRVEVRADSQLLIRQLEGRYRVKHAGLVPLHRRAQELLRSYRDVDLQHVRREENTEADALVNAALDAAAG
jgi:ribonuclease HI